ncbi:MAG TPA: arginine--tRNA ligase [Anaerolineales bacterium]|nr:arginine--tRNA ligase [Anaerolineales bacterium]
MFHRELQALNTQLNEALRRMGAAAPDRVEWSPTPFSGRWGLGTAVCYQVAAAEARSGSQVNVGQRASELARLLVQEVEPPEPFDHLEADKAYLNAYFEMATFAGRVVQTAIELGADYGRGEPMGERVMVEYAQPNTHHSFHIGHARNAILGESVARLAEFAGFETIRASYPGDIGLGVITILWAYERFYRGQEPTGLHERGQWLLKIYAEATTLLTEKEGETAEEKKRREQFESERREMYRRWDAGDAELIELWRRTRQWSLEELDDILRMLNIKIDVFFFESEVDKPSKAIVEELIARGIAEDERPHGGPVIVKIDERLGLKKEKYRVAVILRSDGTTLYATKDLALAKVKFEKYNVDRSVYVVDVRQSLHFQQVFKILELWGFPQARNCYHLAYGFVTLPEGAMSARTGNVVFFKDVADEAHRRVQAVIAEKNPSLNPEERGQVARAVGLGAIAYAMLSVDNTKDILFDWESALSFEGQSAPYIQNAHVRASSILHKAAAIPGDAPFAYELHESEIDLIDMISRFPALVRQAALEYKPLLIANYAYQLAKTFHGFYHVVPVLQAETDAMRDARLRLVDAVRQTLANSLRLLTIEAPEMM